MVGYNVIRMVRIHYSLLRVSYRKTTGESEIGSYNVITLDSASLDEGV